MNRTVKQASKGFCLNFLHRWNMNDSSFNHGITLPWENSHLSAKWKRIPSSNRIKTCRNMPPRANSEGERERQMGMFVYDRKIQDVLTVKASCKQDIIYAIPVCDSFSLLSLIKFSAFPSFAFLLLNKINFLAISNKIAKSFMTGLALTRFSRRLICALWIIHWITIQVKINFIQSSPSIIPEICLQLAATFAGIREG